MVRPSRALDKNSSVGCELEDIEAPWRDVASMAYLSQDSTGDVAWEDRILSSLGTKTTTAGMSASHILQRSPSHRGSIKGVRWWRAYCIEPVVRPLFDSARNSSCIWKTFDKDERSGMQETRVGAEV